MEKLTFNNNSWLKHRPELSADLSDDEKEYVLEGSFINVQAVSPTVQKGHLYVTLSQGKNEKFVDVDGHNSVYVWADHVDYQVPDTTNPEAKTYASTYKLGTEGLKCIKHYEGYRDKNYYCDGGISTIGIGSTRWFDGRPIKEGQTCTEEQAEQLFRRDIKVFEDAVTQCLTVPVTQGQFDALVSFSYNVGEGALAESTLLRNINNRDFESARTQFMRWCRAGGQEIYGLKVRRKSEVDLFYYNKFVPYN